MGKKIYVKGGILVTSRFFTCKSATCLCSVIPDDAEIIIPPSFEGTKCLVIDDEHPQSLFNEYYCETFFSSYNSGLKFLCDNSAECYEEFQTGINEAKDLLEMSIDSHRQWTLYKMIYLQAISCLDSFICSLILSKTSHDEILFCKYYRQMMSPKKKIALDKILDNGERARWEQKVIEEILRTSFCNIDTIKKSFKCLNVQPPTDNNIIIKDHFMNRHILMHRNGKIKGDKKMELTKESVNKAIEEINNYGNHLLCRFNTSTNT